MENQKHKRLNEETTNTACDQMSFPWPKRFVFGLQQAPSQIPIFFNWGSELKIAPESTQ